MAGRPIKQNADYFPHENGMRNDRKLNAVRTKFGIDGYAIYNMLLESLSEANMLMIKFNDMEIEMMAGDFRFEPEKLREMIEYFIKIDLIQNDQEYIKCRQLENRLKGIFDKRNASLDQLRDNFRKINSISATEIPISVSEIDIVKESKVKEIKKEKIYKKENQSAEKIPRFQKPTPQEVENYANSIQFILDGKYFCDSYEAKGWMIGKSKMKDWKAAVRTWKQNDSQNKPNDPTILERVI